jgi:hypothetical protein
MPKNVQQNVVQADNILDAPCQMIHCFLILHVLAELVAASVLLVAPSVFVPTAAHDHQEALRGIGNGALSIALLGVALLMSGRQIGTALGRCGFAILSQYHLGVVLLQLKHPMLGVPWWVAPGFHGLLLLAFASRVATPSVEPAAKDD